MSPINKLTHNTTRQTLSLAMAVFLSLISLSTHATQTVTYYHSNALGSPVSATDEAGNVLWREAYEPYGLRLIKDANSSGNNRYFTGHPEDSSTGLTYMGSRFYDPRVGRFLSPDPQRFKETNLASFNRYAYGNHNPYKFVDPDGEFAIPYVVATGLLAVGGGYVLSKAWQNALSNTSNPELIFNEGDENNASSDSINGQESGSDGDTQDSSVDSGEGSRQKGDRMTSEDNALDQLSEIEEAQRRVRKGKSDQIIDSIEKSKQRAKHSLRPQNIDLDNLDDY